MTEELKPGKTSPELTSFAGRVMCLDALRGFDMFWIVGGDKMIRELAKATNLPFFQGLATQFDHVPWDGFHFYDWIFPLFLFIVGISLPYSFEKRMARGETRGRLLVHALKRVAILVFFGMWINGNLLTYDPAKFQISYSVLQMIALGYLVATVAMLTLSRRGQLIAMLAMPVIHWAFLTFYPVPGFGAGVFTREGNFARYLNELLLGDLQGRWRGGWIWAVQNCGAIALMGVMAGHILKSRRSQWQKLLWLATAGLAGAAVGLLWSIWLPIIKPLWTSSYIFLAGGLGYLTLALFYLLIDIWGKQAWAFPFRVIGMNAIAIYVAWQIFDFRQVASVFVGGLQQYVGPWYGFAQWTGACLAGWLILYHLYRYKIFLKI